MDLEKDTWLWIIIQDPGGNEMFLGQHDEKNNISFIPTFLEKDDAKKSLDMIKKDNTYKYEAQAIKYGLLEQYCKENNFVIFICNASGEILLKPMDKKTGDNK